MNELAYQTAQAKEAAKQQEFINRLNEAIVAGKINKELQNLYADYVSALKTLRNTENQVSQNQTSITSLNKQLLASFDDHIKTYQTNIASYQVELAEKENELKEFMTSTENLTAEKAAAKINELKKEKEEIVETCLTNVGLWNEVKDALFKKGTFLSGGQQQRLCIARALALKPEVLLMDEPTSALDPIATNRIEELLLELKKEFTIIIVTHNMSQAARISDYSMFMLSLIHI